MRTLVATCSLLLLASLANAQMDPGAAAAAQAQQAAMQAQEAAQQAMQQSMQAAQQANQDMMNAMNNANQTQQPCCLFTALPKFSLKAGTYAHSVTVKLTDAARDSVIYYTTDGWTPSTSSQRYKGPIVIDSTTTITAIAITPYTRPSPVVATKYVINGSAPATQAAAPATVALITTKDGKVILPQGTPITLVFTTDVNSKTAAVGDAVSLSLASDLVVGTTVIAQKGSPASATVIQVNKTGIGGAPGKVTIEVDSLQTTLGTIKLSGTVSKDGDAKLPNAAVLIPFAGPFTVFRHGTDAIVPTGTPLTVSTASDVPVPPSA
jgi:hypothetical protein